MKVGDLVRLKVSEHSVTRLDSEKNKRDNEWARNRAPFLLIEPYERLRQWDVLTPDGALRRVNEYLLTTRGIK
jgi:hypothetical protein